ncbi:MAG: amidohydrolase family protein [bacterium]|nr:amidohydrolase family protein [bacterium]
MTNARIETVAEAGTLERATILIKNGKIEAIGTDVDIPVSAQIINATGKVITPGIVDPYFVVPINRNTPESTERTVVFGGRTFVIPGGAPPIATSFAKVADGIDMEAIDWKPALRSGLTTLHLVAGGFAQSAIAARGHENTVSNYPIRDPDGLLLVAVTNNTPTLNVLRSGLTPPGNGERRGVGSRGRGGPPGQSAAGGRGASRGGSAAAAGPNSPGATAALWTRVRNGDTPLFVNVDSASAILHVLKATEAADKIKLAVVADGADVYLNLDNLDSERFSVVLPPRIDQIPNSGVRINVPAMLASRDQEFVLSLSLGQSDFRSMQHQPLFSVAMLVRSGLDRDRALRAITMGPAKLIGMQEEIGSLEVGKRADLLVFDGDPFAATTSLETVFVQGNPVNED